MGISHTVCWGEMRKRQTRLVWESCHRTCIFFPTLSAEATNKRSIAKINTAVTVTSCLIQECSLQRLSKSLHDSNLSWTIHCKKIICAILFVDLKPSLPGTVIRYFHHNRYIFLNSHASLKMTWNWNEWLCQLHNS